MESVTVVYQCAEVGRVACLLATVDLTKPRVHLYERILQGRSRGAACYPLIEVNHGAKCARRVVMMVATETARTGGIGGWCATEGEQEYGGVEGTEGKTVCAKAREPIRGQIVTAPGNHPGFSPDYSTEIEKLAPAGSWYP